MGRNRYSMTRWRLCLLSLSSVWGEEGLCWRERDLIIERQDESGEEGRWSNYYSFWVKTSIMSQDIDSGNYYSLALVQNSLKQWRLWWLHHEPGHSQCPLAVQMSFSVCHRNSESNVTWFIFALHHWISLNIHTRPPNPLNRTVYFHLDSDFSQCSNFYSFLSRVFNDY